MSRTNRWKKFWENQTTPLHRYNNEKWYRLYAEEINLITKSMGYQGGAVLETGCGNGALFDYLDINKENYIGTDISEKLLSIFQNKHPNLNLLCLDSTDYILPQKKFALIFSNGVIQYFNKQQVDLYVKQSLDMLENQGIIILANVLWKDLKSKYYGGELSINPRKNSTVFILKSVINEVLLKDNMGNWYNPRDFIKYQSENVEIQVFGSLFHPYRFSVALKKIV
ncbi:MAG: class I SAM-dependent methyltransferase [Gloeotrichia echinulata IR180]